MPLRKELLAFVNFLDGGPRPHSSAADGAAVVKAISKIHHLAGYQ
jgi:hypothetical protein